LVSGIGFWYWFLVLVSGIGFWYWFLVLVSGIGFWYSVSSHTTCGADLTLPITRFLSTRLDARLLFLAFRTDSYRYIASKL
jgi:hypothetical protein